MLIHVHSPSINILFPRLPEYLLNVALPTAWITTTLSSQIFSSRLMETQCRKNIIFTQQVGLPQFQTAEHQHVGLPQLQAGRHHMHQVQVPHNSHPCHPHYFFLGHNLHLWLIHFNYCCCHNQESNFTSRQNGLLASNPYKGNQ